MSESPIVLHGFVKWLINYCFSVSFACALTWGCKSSQVSKLKGAANGHHIPDILILIWWHLGLWCRNWCGSHKWRVGKSLFLHLPIYQKSCSVNWDFRTVHSTKRKFASECQNHPQQHHKHAIHTLKASPCVSPATTSVRRSGRNAAKTGVSVHALIRISFPYTICTFTCYYINLNGGFNFSAKCAMAASRLQIPWNGSFDTYYIDYIVWFYEICIRKAICHSAEEKKVQVEKSEWYTKTKLTDRRIDCFKKKVKSQRSKVPLGIPPKQQHLVDVKTDRFPYLKHLSCTGPGAPLALPTLRWFSARIALLRWLGVSPAIASRLPNSRRVYDQFIVYYVCFIIFWGVGV